MDKRERKRVGSLREWGESAGESEKVRALEMEGEGHGDKDSERSGLLGQMGVDHSSCGHKTAGGRHH